MRRIHLILALTFLASYALGDDTPFLTFHCVYDRASEDHAFDLRFKNDDSSEVETWSSTFKRTKMRFEKVSKSQVNVWISTGMPVISHAAPEEFRFTAPLTTDDFSFSFGMRPLTVKNEFFSLKCDKVKAKE